MSGKSVTIDFGNVFTSDTEDRDKLVRTIEKNIQLNTSAILSTGAYKHRTHVDGRAARLKVAVEISED